MANFASISIKVFRGYAIVFISASSILTAIITNATYLSTFPTVIFIYLSVIDIKIIFTIPRPYKSFVFSV